MNGGRLLAGALGALASLLFACGGSNDRLGFDFARMRQQTRLDTWAASSVFANGSAMQRPPEHTIARDDGDVAQSAAGRAPVADSAELRTIGARHFAISCAPCHGAAGYGGGRVSVNLVPWPAPSLRSATVQGLSDAELLRIVSNGVGRMPAYAWQLRTAERRAVVAWVRHLTRMPGRDSAAVADSLEADRVDEVMQRWRQFDAERRRAAAASDVRP